MDGLEILLFGVFIIFVLANLFIRFLVRKAKGRIWAEKEEGSLVMPAGAAGTGPFFPEMETVPDEEEKEEAVRETVRISSVSEPAGEIVKPQSFFDTEKEKPVVGSGMEERTRRFGGTIEVIQEKQKRRKTFWERIDSLTPLQRAIVLSEVLGPPKGIDS